MKKNSDISLYIRVKKYIQTHRLISSSDNILIGVSSGSDSIALLHILAVLFPTKQLYVAYINHGLRPKEAKNEQEHVATVCHQYNIEYTISQIDTLAFVEKEHRSIEEAARILRYQQFYKIAQNNNCTKIAVAHTADDQVEHFFIRLFRGSGIQGLAGMRPIATSDHSSNIPTIRPLLFLRKRELQDYLRENDWLWCEDSSNSDVKFLRNRIRNEFLPHLEKCFSPSVRHHVLQMMDIFNKENTYITAHAQEAYKRCVQHGEIPRTLCINCRSFQKEPLAIQRRIIEQCCWAIDENVNFALIEKIIALIKNNRNGQELHFAKGLRVYRENDIVVFCFPLQGKEKRASVKKNIEYSIPIKKDGQYDILPYSKMALKGGIESVKFQVNNYQNYQIGMEKKEDYRQIKTLYIDYDAITYPMQIRPMIEGDYFTPCNSFIQKKIGRFFAEHGISSFQRKSWPLLVSHEQIIAVIGLQIADAYKITESTQHILVIQSISFGDSHGY